MSATTQVLDLLRIQRLLPVLREHSSALAVDRASALITAGCRVVELTTTTPDWPDALGALSGRSDALVGMGTVLDAEQARTAVSAGAGFLVSPWPAPEVRLIAAESGTLFIEGGFTPAEIADAASRGPAKIFPAHVGGPRFLASLRAVLPDAVLVPTGGIAPAQAEDYLAAGALAVGIGSGLPSDPAELAAIFRTGA
jgi:2-dehydro-3-deoxyphosphogluconate aldolase/(4S)-4-hydroxy-2-oxoglutarate aldolase